MKKEVISVQAIPRILSYLTLVDLVEDALLQAYGFNPKIKSKWKEKK